MLIVTWGLQFCTSGRGYNSGVTIFISHDIGTFTYCDADEQPPPSDFMRMGGCYFYAKSGLQKKPLYCAPIVTSTAPVALSRGVQGGLAPKLQFLKTGSQYNGFEDTIL